MMILPAAPWSAPRDIFAGQTVFLVGGGASLKGFDFSRLDGRGRVIAINQAVEFCPFADLLYFADLRWLRWNEKLVEGFSGPAVTRAENVGAVRPIGQIGWNRDVALSRDPAAISGYCSGANALNLAWLMGGGRDGGRVVLAGFDMADNGNWHDRHHVQTREGAHAELFVPSIVKMASELAREGAEVVNAEHGGVASALDCFPKVRLEDVLDIRERE